MTTKIVPARIKAATEADGSGEFTALVSVFNTVDAVGDVVMPGAFTETLAEWKAAGDPIPVVWSHDWNDPFSHIGEVTRAEETAAGLEVAGKLDLDNPTGAQVHRLMKGRRVTGFSFAYDVLDAGPAERDGAYVYELRKLALHEVGPTLVGAHPDATVLSAKSYTPAAATSPAQLAAWAALQHLTEF